MGEMMEYLHAVAPFLDFVFVTSDLTITLGKARGRWCIYILTSNRLPPFLRRTIDTLVSLERYKIIGCEYGVESVLDLVGGLIDEGHGGGRRRGYVIENVIEMSLSAACEKRVVAPSPGLLYTAIWYTSPRAVSP
jgi:hypothetical protein